MNLIFVATGQRISRRLQAKAAMVRRHLETRLDRILQGWLLLSGLACGARIATSSVEAPIGIKGVLPYLLLILAPFASIVFALRWFADGQYLSQPRFRLARFGRWTSVSHANAAAHPLYGAGGMMVSLSLGMLINIPFRALEYLGAMPVLSGSVPPWLSVLHAMMTLDLVLMSSLYAVAFVAALRHVPFFPRLLVAIWGLDLLMQTATAVLVAGTTGLPPAVAGALYSLLHGNMEKVLISVAIWMPYLLLSKRVNVTYRHRVARGN